MQLIDPVMAKRKHAGKGKWIKGAKFTNEHKKTEVLQLACDLRRTEIKCHAAVAWTRIVKQRSKSQS